VRSEYGPTIEKFISYGKLESVDKETEDAFWDAICDVS